MADRQEQGDAGPVLPIDIPYRPRAIWHSFHDSDARFRVAVAHRRAGKTVALVNALIDGALRCRRPAPRYGYIAPYPVIAGVIASGGAFLNVEDHDL